MTVDDTGVVTSIDVKESSGWPVLDRSALDSVKRHWIIPPVGGTHLFEATITYKLTVN
jgi:TonB family protein